MNEFTIVAGAVGVGKSSFIGALVPLKNSLGEIIADGDKTAVRRIQSCMDDGVDFTLESTLSGENTLAIIKTAAEKGRTFGTPPFCPTARGQPIRNSILFLFQQSYFRPFIKQCAAAISALRKTLTPHS